MKNILLIGGSYGIGRTLAEMLSAHSRVIVASRTWEGVLPPNISYVKFDASTDKLDPAVLPERLDGFAYLPGSINLKPFRSLQEKDFEDALRLNFTNMVAILQTVLPRLAASDAASVVLFSSVAVAQGMPFHTAVAAAKGAVEGFALALAAEVAPKIRVNVIAPSLTDSPLAQKFLDSDAKRERSATRHPMQRFGQTRDVADAAAFLLGDRSLWMTGQVLRPDGGLSTLRTT